MRNSIYGWMEAGIRSTLTEYGGKVTVITMGPNQADSALRDCLALGASDAVLLSDRAFAGADTLATAFTLALAIRQIGSTLVEERCPDEDVEDAPGPVTGVNVPFSGNVAGGGIGLHTPPMHRTRAVRVAYGCRVRAPPPECHTRAARDIVLFADPVSS